MFQTPPASAGPPLASLPTKPGTEGEFTRMMNAPLTPSDNLFKPAAPREADVFAPRAGGPVVADEFSRIAAGGGPGATTKAAPAPAAKAKSSILPLVLILVGLLIVVLVVLFLFLR